MRNIFNTSVEAIDGAINVEPTSSKTANASPFNLRQPTDFTRFYFKPILVNNSKEPSNSVKGKLIYEKKGKKDSLFPLSCASGTFSKQGVRNGDSLELSLSTGETMALYQGLRQLYGAYENMGDIPFDSTTFVPVNRTMRALLDILRRDPSAVRMVCDEDNYDLVRELLKLLAQGISQADLHSVFSEIETGRLQELSAGLNIAQLEKARDEMRANLNNENEEDWQKLFVKYQWILSQVFSSPCTFLGSKFYAGGKALDSTGGKIGDFIYSNKLTNNVAFIEIKTPLKPILGQPYRGVASKHVVHSLSADLSGAVNQVLDYKDHFIKEFHSRRYNSGIDFEPFQPKCVVVIGTISDVISQRGISTFENYRNSLNGITIVTFDELIQKVEDLIDVLNAPVTTNGVDAQLGKKAQEVGHTSSNKATTSSDISF